MKIGESGKGALLWQDSLLYVRPHTEGSSHGGEAQEGF